LCGELGALLLLLLGEDDRLDGLLRRSLEWAKRCEGEHHGCEDNDADDTRDPVAAL
jgi:hypothetical protein